MSLPARIRLIGFDFTIREETNPDFTDSLQGQIHSTNHEIRISNNATDQRETLLHEILHGVSDAMDADLTERQVRVVVRGLYAAIRDNPDVAAYLHEQ